MRPTTLSVSTALVMIISQIKSVTGFSPSPSFVIRKFGHQNKIPSMERRRSHHQLFLMEESLSTMAGSFLISGSALPFAAIFAMDDSTIMMTPEYAALDSDPYVSLALAVMFVSILTLISLGPSVLGEEESTVKKTEKEDLVVAQAAKVERIPTREMGPAEVAKPNNQGRVESSSSNVSQQNHGLPLEIGALLKAYKDGDDHLFQRALALLVETIRFTTSELNETKRLLRLAQEEKRSLEDKYDLRVYQLIKAEEKLKELRSSTDKQ